MGTVSAKAVAEIMEQVFHLSYNRNFSGGLRPTQWMALRYFGQAEDAARTVSRFARHNRTTTGSASQTVDALVRRGLLERNDSFGDRRSHRLDLTETGRALLVEDPVADVVAAIEALEPERRFEFAECLEIIFRQLVEGES